MAGARLALDDTKTSDSTSTSESHNVGLHIVPRLRPDEIALQFACESGAALVLIKGQRPMWVLRVNYNDSRWFAGTFTPIAKWQDQHAQGAKPSPLWERSSGAFRGAVAAFNGLSRGMG